MNETNEFKHLADLKKMQSGRHAAKDFENSKRRLIVTEAQDSLHEISRLSEDDMTLELGKKKT